MIDLKKALNGMGEIRVEGKAISSLRQKKIEKAIALSQNDPEWKGFFWDHGRQYFGVKNYANCGDQDADCKEGTSPRHGSIVFSIHWKSQVGEDGIYLLKLCAENSEVDVCKLLQKHNTLSAEPIEINEGISKLQEFQDA